MSLQENNQKLGSIVKNKSHIKNLLRPCSN